MVKLSDLLAAIEQSGQNINFNLAHVHMTRSISHKLDMLQFLCPACSFNRVVLFFDEGSVKDCENKLVNPFTPIICRRCWYELASYPEFEYVEAVEAWANLHHSVFWMPWEPTHFTGTACIRTPARELVSYPDEMVLALPGNASRVFYIDELRHVSIVDIIERGTVHHLPDSSYSALLVETLDGGWFVFMSEGRDGDDDDDDEDEDPWAYEDSWDY